VQPQYSSVQPQYSSVQPQYSSVQPQMTKPLQDNVQFDDFKMMPKVFESTDWSSNQIALQPSINQSQLSTNQGVNINQSQVSPNQGIQIKKEEPIFIKLEKFENTISTFNEIKLRISEIETLLRTIKSIKQKEESELNEWENELEIIKSRLDQINQEMFKGI
ncbi:MAG TPA: hypothetical protein P5277_04195, partial [Candidatus Paceibacterota bacterium]|nr:hypothetical protein [Candidatus Paceibacterota bacterium]